MNKIPDFFGMYAYDNYDQLRRLRRDFPKRCAETTPSGIPCEYYTMPRNVDAPPHGYTPYTQHQIYDVNNEGKLVRVCVRIPQYIDSNGKVCQETFHMENGKYTHDALNMLHQKFCNPEWTYDNLQKSFPLGKNATADAYQTLLPWAKRNHVFPDYPDSYTHLWFVSVPYKQSILTFCTYGYLDEEPTSFEFSLFDILIDNDFESLQNLKKYAYGSNKTACICMPANYDLYKILHTILPDAKYTFDEFQSLTVMKHCANKIPEIKQLFLSKRTETLAILKQLFYRKCSTQKAQSVCVSAIRFLLDYSNTHDLSWFKNSLELILQEQPHFIDDYFEINEFHLFLPFQIQKSIQDFLKKRGYEATRLSYMLLARVRNLPYVEPDACYSIVAAFMTEEEIDEMYEEYKQVEFNALMSSVLENLDWMSNGEFPY